MSLNRAQRHSRLQWGQLDKKHHKPIKYDRISSVDGKSVRWKDIVKGFEISRGTYVIVDDEDFKSVAPEMTRAGDDGLRPRRVD